MRITSKQERIARFEAFLQPKILVAVASFDLSTDTWHSQNGKILGHSQLPTNQCSSTLKKKRLYKISCNQENRPKKQSKTPSTEKKCRFHVESAVFVCYLQVLLHLGVPTVETSGSTAIGGDVAATHGDPQTFGGRRLILAVEVYLCRL